MLRGIKLRLYPNAEQERYARRLCGSCRFIYNHLTAYINSFKDNNQPIPSPKERYAFYVSLQKSFPFLKELHSKVRQEARIDFNAALDNHFKRHTGWPTFKKRGYDESCRFPVDAIIGASGNRISLTKNLKNILFKCSKEDMRFLNRHRSAVRSATLKCNPDLTYSLSVLVEDGKDYTLPKQEVPKYAGVDLGLKDFAVVADGETVRKIPNPKYLKKWKRRLAKAQRVFSRRKKGGRNRFKAKARVARAHAKTRDFRTEFLQRESTRLVSENQGVAVETLNVKGLMRNHKLARGISDASWGRFMRMLEYKCRKYGRDFRQAGRWFASSQTCHVCGCVSPVTKDLKVRQWVCPDCGAVLDRDANAAENLRMECFRLELGLGSPEVTPVEVEALASGAACAAPEVKLPSLKQETKTGALAIPY